MMFVVHGPMIYKLSTWDLRTFCSLLLIVQDIRAVPVALRSAVSETQKNRAVWAPGYTLVSHDLGTRLCSLSLSVFHRLGNVVGKVQFAFEH